MGSVDTQKVKRFRVNFDNPFLWSAEKPNLYDLKIQLFDDKNKVMEVIHEKVGFRKFVLDGGIMKLNGKRIVFKGVNRHEFSCDTGRVVAKEDVEKDVLMMKQNNINGIRTSHYPNGEHLYRLCDEQGLYMIAENNMESHGLWERTVQRNFDRAQILPGDNEEYLPMMLDRVNSTYQKDKNLLGEASFKEWRIALENLTLIAWCTTREYFGIVDIQIHRIWKAKCIPVSPILRNF